jgi:glycolate oxidase FAD binding subunit
VKNDISRSLLEQVTDAYKQKTSLTIIGGSSKTFYGNHVDGTAISTAEHTGIIEYQPSELVVTVRSGTLLSELEAELKTNNQMLAFEPPQHSENSTIGGVIACGLSGPRRVACGSARDFVLGTTIINGKAEKLRFGGQVMKNVAGYDASRLMVGAQGTLGLLLDISLKVLPVSKAELTLKLAIDLQSAIKTIHQWIMSGLPLSASCYYQNTLYLRLSSTSSAVKQAINTINKTQHSEQIDNTFWLHLKNQKHDFFTQNTMTPAEKLWRCSHQYATEFYQQDEAQLIEWNGALRWIKSDKNLHTAAAQYNGHATLYSQDVADEKPAYDSIFQPLTPASLKIHQRLKQAFDPENILNAGRLYAEL